MKIPPNAKMVETIDGRIFFSDDNWETVWLIKRGGKPRQVTGEVADLGRFLAIHAH